MEKRIRKTPEFSLGQTFQENGRAYAKHGSQDEPGGLSQFLMDSGHLLNDLATSHVQYEIGVEKLVLQSLTGIVDDHVPTINKERKNLSSLLLDYDAAKSRLVNYRQKEGSGSSHGGTVESDLREDRLASELAEIETKVPKILAFLDPVSNCFFTAQFCTRFCRTPYAAILVKRV